MVRCSTYNVLHLRKFSRLIYCLAWFDTVEFNRLLCPNEKMYNDVIFADRSRYPLTMSGNRVLIKLSRLLHDHIVYETDTAKIIAAFCRISYCLYDYIRLNSICYRVKTLRCTMMQFSLIDSVIHWLCSVIGIWIVLSWLLHDQIAYEIDTAKIIA